MRLFFDVDRNVVLQELVNAVTGVESYVPVKKGSIVVKRGSSMAFEVFPVHSDMSVATVGDVLVFGVKKAGVFDGDYLVGTRVWSFNNFSGGGMMWRFGVIFSSLALNEALCVDSDVRNDLASVDCGAELSCPVWLVDGENTRVSSTFPITIQNNIIRLDEPLPDLLPMYPKPEDIALKGDLASLQAASVPAGGAGGQMLAKASAANHDVAWVDPPAGGGGSTSQLVSVNGGYYKGSMFEFKAYSVYDLDGLFDGEGPLVCQLEMRCKDSPYHPCITISNNDYIFGVYTSSYITSSEGFSAMGKMDPYALDTSGIYFRAHRDQYFNPDYKLSITEDGRLMWRGESISERPSLGGGPPSPLESIVVDRATSEGDPVLVGKSDILILNVTTWATDWHDPCIYLSLTDGHMPKIIYVNAYNEADSIEQISLLMWEIQHSPVAYVDLRGAVMSNDLAPVCFVYHGNIRSSSHYYTVFIGNR